MKKTAFYLVMVLLLSTFSGTVMATEKNPVPIGNDPTTEIPAKFKPMLDRLEEIKNMDKSDLKSSDRKALRKEVRDIKSTLKATGGGLYISAGAIIIILLLLLIL